MLSSCPKPLKYTLKQTPPRGFYCPQCGGKLPFPCNFASHHCIGHCTAAKRPRTTAKRIYSIAKRPRTIAKRFCSIVSCPCSGAGCDCTAIPSALLVAMEFSCLVKLAGIPHLFRIPCRRLPSLSRQREVCSTGSQAMSPYGARQKPSIADDTASSTWSDEWGLIGSRLADSLNLLMCGKVGRRQSFLRSFRNETPFLFFAAYGVQLTC